MKTDIQQNRISYSDSIISIYTKSVEGKVVFALVRAIKYIFSVMIAQSSCGKVSSTNNDEVS